MSILVLLVTGCCLCQLCMALLCSVDVLAVTTGTCFIGLGDLVVVMGTCVSVDCILGMVWTVGLVHR